MKQIDLSKLPAPVFCEQKTYDVVIGEIKKRFQEIMGETFELTDSDPAAKILESIAYREILIRKEIQYAGTQTLAAYATDSNLDNVLAVFGGRLPGETDIKFRERALLVPDAKSTAGSFESYLFFAQSADIKPPLKDVAAVLTEVGSRTVAVVALSSVGDGLASKEQLAQLTDALNNPKIRPVHDALVIRTANIIYYRVKGTLFVPSGSDASLVLEAAKKFLADYYVRCHAIGRTVSLPAIHRAVFVAEVLDAEVQIVLLTKKPDGTFEDGASVAAIRCTMLDAPFCPISVFEDVDGLVVAEPKKFMRDLGEGTG